MDFSALDDVLEEDTYIPTFGKANRTANKSLTKNSSAKSIENAAPTPPPPPPPKTNLLQIHRETRKEVMSFQDMLKNQSQPPAPVAASVPEKRAQSKQVRFQSPKQSRKPAAKLNDSYWNDDDDDAPPAIVPNRMKPPIMRRGEDNKSVASRRNDENRSVASNADFKKREEEQPFNNLSAPQPNISINLTPPLDPLQKTREIKRQQVYSNVETRQINVVADTSQLKKMLEEQLQLQRQFSEKIIKEQQQNHKREVQKLKEIHAEELSRKMELKNLQIQKLKEFYEMQLKARGQRADQLRQLQLVSRKVEEGIKALGKAEEGLRSKGAQYESSIQAKVNQNKLISDFTTEKENHVQQLFSKLQAREKEFREERQRSLAELDRERRKLQELQSKLHKRQRQLQERYTKKQRTLVEQYQDKQRKLNEEQSQLRLKRMQLQQDRLRLQQQRQENHIRQKKADESRTKLMQQLQAERIKLATRELQITSKSHEWQTKQNELLMKEREVAGRFKLIQLERKRVEVEREMKRKTGMENKVGFNFDKSQIGPSPLEKSIKQLKDEYLRNLGHI